VALAILRKIRSGKYRFWYPTIPVPVSNKNGSGVPTIPVPIPVSNKTGSGIQQNWAKLVLVSNKIGFGIQQYRFWYPTKLVPVSNSKGSGIQQYRFRYQIKYTGSILNVRVIIPLNFYDCLTS
jgi:hypothetical protein